MELYYDHLSPDCDHHIIRDGWGQCDLTDLECTFENCPKVNCFLKK